MIKSAKQLTLIIGPFCFWFIYGPPDVPAQVLSIEQRIQTLTQKIDQRSEETFSNLDQLIEHSIELARLYEYRNQVTNAFKVLSETDREISEAIGINDENFIRFKLYYNHYCKLGQSNGLFDCSPIIINHAFSEDISYRAYHDYLQAKREMYSGDLEILTDNISKLKKSLDYFGRKKNSTGLITDILLTLGISYYLVDSDSADYYLNELFALENAFQPEVILAHIEKNYGFIQSSNYERALFHCLKIVELNEALKLYPESSDAMVDIYNNVGIAYAEIGESPLALKYYDLAKAYFANNAKDERYYNLLINEAIALQNQKQFQASINVNLQVLSWYKENKNEIIVDRIQNNLAYVYQLNHQYENAENYYQKSIESKIRNYGYLHSDVAWSIVNLGHLYCDKGQFEKGKQQFNKALKILTDQGISNGVIHSSAFEGLSRIEAANKKFDQAIVLLEGAIRSTHLSSELSLIPDNLNDIQDRKRILDLLQQKTAIQYFQYMETKDSILLIEGLMDIHQMLELINQYLDFYYTRSARYEFIELVNKIVRQGVDMYYELYSIDSLQSHIMGAILLAENGRSILLREHQKKIALNKMNNVPDSIIARERSLINKIDKQEKSLLDSVIQQTEIKKVLIDLYSQLRKTRKLINEYTSFPSDNILWNSQEIVQAQSDLSKNKLIAYYQYGTHDLHIFTITRDRIGWHFVKDHNVLDEKLNGFNRLAIQGPGKNDQIISIQSYSQLSLELYEQIIGKIPDIGNTKSIEIIPDGLLYNIPFSALITKKASGNISSFRDLSYLINKYDLNYKYTLCEYFKKPPKRNLGIYEYAGFAPFSDIQFDQSSGIANFVPLPYTKSEIEQAAAHFEGKSFIGHEATSDSFRIYADQANIIHLGTHALASENNSYLNSGIAFYSKDSTRPEFINIYDIQNLSVNASLAILSACQTGAGGYVPGEGILSLARAFQFAGCPNTVISLWNANDFAISQIMGDFISNLQDNPIHVAISQSQRNFLNTVPNPELTHPFYWAGLLSIGPEYQIIDEPMHVKLLVTLLLSIFVLGFITILYKYRINS